MGLFCVCTMRRFLRSLTIILVSLATLWRSNNCCLAFFRQVLTDTSSSFLRGADGDGSIEGKETRTFLSQVVGGFAGAEPPLPPEPAGFLGGGGLKKVKSCDYHFLTHWRVTGTIDDVADILIDPLDLVRWWPSVYLDVKEIKPGDDNQIGRVIDLFTTGWLPYTLKWQCTIVEVERHARVVLKAKGDFIGSGVWTFNQDGEWADITYDWRVAAKKPLLKWLSPVMKPIFSANHHWAMDQGLKSLRIELQRRRANSPEQLNELSTPPQATFTFGLLRNSSSQTKGQ